MTYATGFAYDAGLHCHDCTAKRFGPPADAVSPWVGVTDSEGNEIGVTFPGSEFDYAPTCEDCGEEIDAVNLSATDDDKTRDANWYDRGAQEHWHDIESGAILVSENDLDGLDVEACYAGPCEAAREAIERVADGEIQIGELPDAVRGALTHPIYDFTAKGAPSPTRPGH